MLALALAAVPDAPPKATVWCLRVLSQALLCPQFAPAAVAAERAVADRRLP